MFSDQMEKLAGHFHDGTIIESDETNGAVIAGFGAADIIQDSQASLEYSVINL